MNKNDDVKKVIKEYLNKNKEYRDYLDQFISSATGDERLPPKRALNREELDRLEKMHEEVEQLHTKMVKKLRG